VNLTDAARVARRLLGGMRSVGNSRLCRTTELLIVDEQPGLDPEERLRFRKLIVELAAIGS